MRGQILRGLTAILVLGLLSACAQMRQMGGPEHPPPQRDFVVFFAGESTVLGPDANEVIRQVADTARQIDRRLRLQAEASGDSAHAAFLAQTRINVVTQALVADGIDSGRIDISPAPRQPDQVGVIARRVMIQFEP